MHQPNDFSPSNDPDRSDQGVFHSGMLPRTADFASSDLLHRLVTRGPFLVSRTPGRRVGRVSSPGKEKITSVTKATLT